MPDGPDQRDEIDPTTRRRVGLCADCLNARRIPSSRGAIFYLCEYSAIDSAYPKYPSLPVTRCAAYRRMHQLNALS